MEGKSLLPFGAGVPCVKCGHPFPEVRYQAEADVFLGSLERVPEHLVYRCPKCGYAWETLMVQTFRAEMTVEEALRRSQDNWPEPFPEGETWREEAMLRALVDEVRGHETDTKDLKILLVYFKQEYARLSAENGDRRMRLIRAQGETP